MSVSKVMEQCTERQMVEDFGVLRSDAVLLGVRFSILLPNVAKHSSSDSVVSHIRRLIAGSPQFVTVCFATLQNNHSFETRDPQKI